MQNKDVDDVKFSLESAKVDGYMIYTCQKGSIYNDSIGNC